MRAGIWFYGLATVVTGILDLVWGAFEASHQPLRAPGAACSWRTCTRIYRRCLAGRGRRGDLVANAPNGWEQRGQPSSTWSLPSFDFPGSTPSLMFLALASV